jgi:hypothetical protein
VLISNLELLFKLSVFAEVLLSPSFRKQQEFFIKNQNERISKENYSLKLQPTK